METLSKDFASDQLFLKFGGKLSEASSTVIQIIKLAFFNVNSNPSS